MAVYLSRDSLAMGYVSAMAVNGDASTIYLGRRWSTDRQRMNLSVVKLDAAGNPIGPPRELPDNESPLIVGARSSVERILLDEARRRLWLACSIEFTFPDPPPLEPRLLTVYELDAQGIPISGPSSPLTEMPGAAIEGMARHPFLDLLYLVDGGEPAVWIQRLDGAGSPSGAPERFSLPGLGKAEVAVSAGGDRLYLGTFPDTLEIFDLDPAGFPILPAPGAERSFEAGLAPGADAEDYFRFHLGPGAIYRRHPKPTEQAAPKWPLVVWLLDDATGNPVGDPREMPEWTGRAEAVDAARNRVWIAADDEFADAYTGAPIRDGTTPVEIELEDGAPTGQSRNDDSRYGQQGVLIELAANGTPVVLTERFILAEPRNQVAGYHVRGAVLAADLAPDMQPSAELWISGATQGEPTFFAADFILGTPQTQPLDPYLKDREGPVALKIGVRPWGDTTLLERLSVRIEILDGDPDAGGAVLKMMEEDVRGNCVVFLVPGYGFMPPGTRVSHIELMSVHARQYLAAAMANAVAPAERPRQFIVATYMMGHQGHLEQLETMARTMASLGINTVGASDWDGIPPATIDATLDGFGLQRRSVADYAPLLHPQELGHTMPLVYFDFYLNDHRADLTTWAEHYLEFAARTSGASAADVVDFKIADEPAWYYPEEVRRVRNEPAYLAAFRDYLEGQGFTPDFFGKMAWLPDATKWQGIEPIDSTGAGDLPTRRLFYWTMRFFTESAAKGFALASSAVETTFGHALNADVNWNNWIGYWYRRRNEDGDSGMGFVDWMTSGRQNARTLWTEDWFDDREAQLWSVYGDALRSCAMLGPATFGAYVVGVTLGRHPAAAAYRILSLVGHGAKSLDLYTFGPGLYFGDGWSEWMAVYTPIADALRLVGRAESLLFPGVPERGTVALMLAGASTLWDPDPETTLAELELVSIHYALVHDGYTIDFVDDVDVAGGALAARGYSALYVVGPNVAAEAQAQIAAWVQNGGWLVVTPGAAVADEYNTPANMLDAVLGLEPRVAVRTHKSEGVANLPGGSITITDASFGAGAMTIMGPAAALEPTPGAAVDVVAELAGGGAAITRHPFGAGTAVAYGFFPGWQYWQTTIDPWADRGKLPVRWGARERACVTAPVKLAGTPKRVTLSEPLVEACKLASAGGTAVVLLNWSGTPIPQLSVVLPGAAGFARVTSAQRTPLIVAAAGADLEVKLALEHVDILLFD